MNSNPRLDIDENTYIEARFKGKTFQGYKRIFLGKDEPRRGRLRDTARPRIKIVNSFIPTDFQNDHPADVTAFYRAIEKRKNGG